MEINEDDKVYEVASRGIGVPHENVLQKILKGFGFGSLVVGGGILLILFQILQFLVTACAGLGMIGVAIGLFGKGNILAGLLALLIGTPLAIWLASTMLPFVLIIAILAGIVWGIAHLSGSSINFNGAWDLVWFTFKCLLLLTLAALGIVALIQAFKKNDVGSFFKEYWFGILFFCFLAWLFFH